MGITKKDEDKRIKINASLLPETEEEAKKIGRGNRSLGIEIAIAHQRAHNENRLKDNDGFIEY